LWLLSIDESKCGSIFLRHTSYVFSAAYVLVQRVWRGVLFGEDTIGSHHCGQSHLCRLFRCLCRSARCEHSIQSSNFVPHRVVTWGRSGEGIGGYRGAPGVGVCLESSQSRVQQVPAAQRARLFGYCRTMRVVFRPQNAWFAEHPRKRSDGGSFAPAIDWKLESLPGSDGSE
jgi:hypothetical protein